ncbi:MAG: MBL fold metallo-hydrolase [Syntrophales bacterium]|nr:MBL fold metallo-hydrolase [Syntrophales bacterium]
MKVQFIGSGDAFGSGGRFNTCIHITGAHVNFLIDCGASSLIALKSNHVELNEIGLILVTHFHADHFGGIPFFILNAQFSKRLEPLIIAGPPGLAAWYDRAMETAFPGSSGTKQRFAMTFQELSPHTTRTIGNIVVTAFPTDHGSPGGPCLAYRIEAEGRTIAFTGDTDWTDALIAAGQNADLLISEAYSFDRKVRMHMDLSSLKDHLHLMNPKRVILTHMGNDMLAHKDEAQHETAEDGKIIEI